MPPESIGVQVGLRKSCDRPVDALNRNSVSDLGGVHRFVRMACFVLVHVPFVESLSITSKAMSTSTSSLLKTIAQLRPDVLIWLK